MLNHWSKDWPFIRQVIRVTRDREELRKSQPTTSIHYYVSNRELNATELARVIRDHWTIENKVHYVKDVVFQEDKTTKYRNPFIDSTCLDFALNMLRLKKVNNIRKEIYQNSINSHQINAQFNQLL